MISLTCTSCKKVLEIDDAFAGGVCRCRHCGTIQTVPSSLKPSSRPGSPAVVTAAKTLYQRPSRDSAAATAGSSPTDNHESETAGAVPAVDDRRTRSAAPELSQRPSQWFSPSPAVILPAAGAIVILIALLLWLIFR